MIEVYVICVDMQLSVLINVINFLVTKNPHGMSSFIIVSNSLANVYDKWPIYFDFIVFIYDMDAK